MKEILFWVLPPLVGAFIGYITNMVAIKMLFRPLKTVKLFGLPLPFTPGILPKERHKLAESIGRMVEQELLTPEVLRGRLAKEEVQETIGNALSGYTGDMLDRPLSSFAEEKQDDFPLAEVFGNFINSDVFNSFLEEIIKGWAGGRTSLSDEEEGFRSWFKSRIRDIGSMFVPATRDIIKSGLVKELKNHEKGEPSLFRSALQAIIEKYPGITLGEFISLGDNQKKRIDSFIAEKANTAADENIESALESVDVSLLVKDRIDSLEMIKVEKIILDIMANQLKWINFFGGLLGALIGFVQVILSLVMPK